MTFEDYSLDGCKAKSSKTGKLECYMERNGISCHMANPVTTTESVRFKLTFTWNEKLHQVDAFEGFIHASCRFLSGEQLKYSQMIVNIVGSGHVVEMVVPMNGVNEKQIVEVAYIFSLRPFSVSRDLEPLMAANFAATEHTDVNLIVEGEKIPVNKALLCQHSQFFRDVFNVVSTRNRCEDVTIERASAKDFVRFLSMIHQHPYFPNAQTAERMLELAKDYGVPSVTGQVEQMLALGVSAVGTTSKHHLLYLADKYKLVDVEKKVLAEIKTPIGLKEVWDSIYYDGFSDITKLKLFGIGYSLA